MRTVYYNGRVYTGKGFVSAFCVENGRFGDAGTDGDLIASLADEDRAVDLEGRFVSPGFIDSHMHLLGFGKALGMARLADCTDSLAHLLDCVRGFMRDFPPAENEWVQGRGWNQDYFTDVHRMPDRRDLDSVSRDVPIILTRACGHCLAANSKALEICGITRDTPAPEGGAIGMENGEPNGLFFDNAMDLVYSCIPAPRPEQVRAMIARAAHELNRYGITSVQTDDYAVFHGVPWETVEAAYRTLEDSGELTVRVYEQANFSDTQSLARYMDAGRITGTGSDMFRAGPLKLLGDGSLGGRTACLSRPYADDPSTRGFNLFSDEHMRAMVSAAHARGMQVAVHAIGDACLDQVLDAIEAAQAEHPRQDCRHGIVHCQVTRADQLDRIARLGLHVYAQSIFLDYDNHIVRQRVGDDMASTSYSWKALMQKGVSVSNGSDCPVELPNVMEGIRCAVTRTSLDGTGPYLPEQAFTVREAIDSFTVEGARASFEEGRKGRIAKGYLADFTVLDEDPFAVDPLRLHEIPVRATYLGGRKVYGE